MTPAAEAALRQGHPWIYAEGLREWNRPGRSGEFAVLYDGRNRFLGIGLFDPDSPLRVRLLHVGKPRPLDDAWWRAHLEAALARRAGLFTETTNGYRCLNGESDGWPGLVLDRYDTTLVAKLYTAAWFPHWQRITNLLTEALPHDRLVLRLSRNLAPPAEGLPGDEAAICNAEDREPLVDGRVVRGLPLEGPVVFRENGLRFEADVLKGQKTGFFLDQRENRAQVETLARGREVLNAFSFSGGFSLYAARGGARSVTDVDLSAHALESARRNWSLNREQPGLRACKHEGVQTDVFSWLKEGSERQWDLVILDPPSLARKESQRAEAIKAYRRLASSGIERLRRGGLLVAASCSAHVSAQEFFTLVRQSAKQSRRLFRELRTTGHPPDHPATFPEAQYLKAIYLRMD